MVFGIIRQVTMVIEHPVPSGQIQPSTRWLDRNWMPSVATKKGKTKWFIRRPEQTWAQVSHCWYGSSGPWWRLGSRWEKAQRDCWGIQTLGVRLWLLRVANNQVKFRWLHHRMCWKGPLPGPEHGLHFWLCQVIWAPTTMSLCGEQGKAQIHTELFCHSHTLPFW